MITARRRKRLRKRSDANSTAAKRLSQVVFYLDESIYSHQLADRLTHAGAQTITPRDAGLIGSNDETWLTAVGRKRWIALMRDQNIKRRMLERRALVAASVGAFVCVAGEGGAQEIASAVVLLLQKFVNIAISEPRPFIYTFGLGGSLRKLPTSDLK